MQLKATHLLPHLVVCGLLLARCADGSTGIICRALVTALTHSDSFALYGMLKQCGNDVRDFNDMPILHGLVEKKTTKLKEHLKELKNHGFDINQKGPRGQTAVSFAASLGDWHSVEALSDDEADLDIPDDTGRTALHHAVEHGPGTDVLEELLRNNASVDAQDENGETPLIYAIRRGNVKQIKLLLAHGANPNHSTPDVTPLHAACCSGNVNAVAALLEYGADITSKDYDGQTPLHLAARDGRLDIAKLLIEKGANVNVEDNARKMPFHTAVIWGHFDLATLLLDKGAKFNAEDGSGWILLHATGWDVKMAELRISKGADVNVKNYEGQTPLHLAARQGRLDIAELCIKNGADVEAKDRYNETPLHYAATKGHNALITLLLDEGAEIEAPNSDGWTPLHVAVRDVNTVELLISRGANVNSKDIFGRTPLHHAARRGFIDTVGKLIDNGAEIEAKAKYSERTPFDDAMANGHSDIARLLKRRHAERKDNSANA